MTHYNHRAMKISGYIRFALMIILLADAIHSAIPQQDRLDSQILDPFVVDVKAKRPFCNAFTGCGRKRSSTGPMGQQNLNFGYVAEGGKIVRLPLPLYRALLRAASQEMNNQMIQHQEQQLGPAGEYNNNNNNNNNNRLQEIPQFQEFDISSSPQKIISPRDQYES